MDLRRHLQSSGIAGVSIYFECKIFFSIRNRFLSASLMTLKDISPKLMAYIFILSIALGTNHGHR